MLDHNRLAIVALNAKFDGVTDLKRAIDIDRKPSQGVLGFKSASKTFGQTRIIGEPNALSGINGLVFEKASLKKEFDPALRGAFLIEPF